MHRNCVLLQMDVRCSFESSFRALTGIRTFLRTTQDPCTNRPTCVLRPDVLDCGVSVAGVRSAGVVAGVIAGVMAGGADFVGPT